MIFRRCLFCEGRIWFWQRMGWKAGVGYWHPVCHRREREGNRDSIGFV